MRFWSAIDLLHCNGILPLVLEWWFLPLEEGKIIFHSMVSAKSPKKNPGQKCLLAWPPPLHLRSNQREKGEHWSSLFLSPQDFLAFFLPVLSDLSCFYQLWNFCYCYFHLVFRRSSKHQKTNGSDLPLSYQKKFDNKNETRINGWKSRVKAFKGLSLHRCDCSLQQIPNAVGVSHNMLSTVMTRFH